MIGSSPAPVKASPRLGFRFRPQPLGIESFNLPSTAVLLFTILVDESKRRGWRTRLTNAALGARLNRSVATVKRLLALLESRGLIQREHVADGRIRTATKVTWDGVAQPCATEQASVAQSQSGGGSLPLRGVAHSQATDLERPPESAPSDGEVSPSKEEKGQSSPPLSAEDVRRAIADGVAGVYAPAFFPAEPPAASSPHSEPPVKVDAPAKPVTARATTPARAATAKPYGGLPLHRTGVHAIAAAYSPEFGAVRNTPEGLRYQAEHWRELRADLPPALPIEGPPPTGERPAILPNPPSRGALANPGKL